MAYGDEDDDQEENYCDCCWREISTYQLTVGEGLCSDCKSINDEEEAL